MHQKISKLGAWLAATAVALGAFGAHGLKKIVEPESVATFETGVRYQMYHAFAILVAGMLYRHYPVKSMRVAIYLFTAGIVLFSGSLYLLTLFKATHMVGLSGLGLITPLGGVCLIAGWMSLAYGIGKHR